MQMAKPNRRQTGWTKIPVDPTRGGLLEEKL